jgi:hypothetical protein
VPELACKRRALRPVYLSCFRRPSQDLRPLLTSGVQAVRIGHAVTGRAAFDVRADWLEFGEDWSDDRATERANRRR